MMSRVLLVLTSALTILAGTRSAGQETPRNVQWSEDLDYLIARLEITHPNLYANISRESFLASADQLRQRIPTATDVEMVFGIQELVARIKNGHTLCRFILYMSNNEALKAQFQFYPVMCYPYDDGLYVVASAEEYEATLGKKVVRIGKLTSDEAMRELARFVAGDNDMATLALIPIFFLNDGQLLRYIGASDSPDSITLGLENDDGSTFDFQIRTDPNYGTAAVRWLTMTSRSDNPTPLYRKHARDNYWFEYLPEKQAV
jgi:hypothetical protein